MYHKYNYKGVLLTMYISYAFFTKLVKVHSAIVKALKIKKGTLKKRRKRTKMKAYVAKYVTTTQE